MNKKRIINLILGPLLLVLCIQLLPQEVFVTTQSRAAIGTVAWMAFWWVMAPVDYAVTAFLPIVVNAFLQMTDMSAVIANYASETILLLLGSSILAASWEITGLDKRIAAMFLTMIGSKLRHQIIFWFLMSATLSAVLPNAVVCATVTPIAVSMLHYIGQGDIANSKAGSKLLLTIVYAAGMGGLASPLGGAMNLVTVQYLEEITGQEYLYVSWFIRFLPVMVVLTVSNLLFLLRDVKKDSVLGGSREYFEQNFRSMPPMGFEEICSLALFLIATVLSFTRQLYQQLLPGLKPAYVFITCSMLAFCIANSGGQRLMIWKKVQTKIVWEMIYVFAGGLACGTLVNQSGAAKYIGQAVAAMNLNSSFLLVTVIITMTLLLSDVTSNTATAAIAMPLVISIVGGIGQNPIPYIYVASIGVNLSYMFPTSIRAIPVGYGLEPKYMLKEGWKMTVLVLVLMTLCGWLLMEWWPAFSTI